MHLNKPIKYSTYFRAVALNLESFPLAVEVAFCSLSMNNSIKTSKTFAFNFFFYF